MIAAGILPVHHSGGSERALKQFFYGFFLQEEDNPDIYLKSISCRDLVHSAMARLVSLVLGGLGSNRTIWLSVAPFFLHVFCGCPFFYTFSVVGYSNHGGGRETERQIRRVFSLCFFCVYQLHLPLFFSYISCICRSFFLVYKLQLP